MIEGFKFKIFVDLDGVIFDFEHRFISLYGKPIESFHSSWVWEQINSDPDYFFKIPLMAGVQPFWAAIAPYNPTVLTGCPRVPGFDQAAIAKRKAVSKYFGASVPVIACLSKDKALHMVQPGDILIDDHERNIQSWRKAGGTGILFTDHTQAIIEFNRTVEALSSL